MTGAREPETLSQAGRWEAVKSRGVAAGLCDACAGQLAWGSQAGFADVHPPCDGCRPIVEAWPVAKPSGWRVRAGSLSRPETWTPPAENVSQGRRGIYGARNAETQAESSRAVTQRHSTAVIA